MTIDQAVIRVIAEVLHRSPDGIAVSDTLSDLGLETPAERGNLANEINEFFQDELDMQFDTLMHTSETRADQTVGEVIQKVRQKNPRPRDHA